MQKIYLDHAATTPTDPGVVKAMLPYFCDKFGNASSIHAYGQEARNAVDDSRHTIAEFLNCKSTEVIFISGGSEADNLAIKGVVESRSFDFAQDDNVLPHVVTSAFEHHAVLETVKELEADGKIEATFIKPNKEGLIEVADVEAAIKSNTVLVSIMYVNNEIGTVQPIRLIGKAIEKINRKRQETRNNNQTNSKFQTSNNSAIRQFNNRIFFHTDAVQAAEYFDMNVDTLHVDLLTMSAHKIYGPKGIGLLYVRSGTPIKHQIVGGGQEYKKRAGTENVAGIVGFAKAVELISIRHSEAPAEESLGSFATAQDDNNEIATSAQGGLAMTRLRDKLIDGLLQIPNSFLNGSRERRSPANVNVSFMNAEGEAILLNLDMEGIAASTGSACTSGSLEPSHVLLSMGLKPEECHGSIRFTLGRHTTEEEIDKVLEIMPSIIEKLRKMSPFGK